VSGYARFDLHATIFAVSVMSKAAPLPVCGSLEESALDGIAMNVFQVLDKFPAIADVAIIIPSFQKRECCDCAGGDARFAEAIFSD